MPFRIPIDYETLSVDRSDPSPEEVAEYAAWLRLELATAEAWLATHAERPAAADGG